MKVLITGGAGFIGSHLCERLTNERVSVTILDNLSSGSQKNILHLNKKLQVFEGDIRDKKLVDSLTEKNDLIIHLAASLGVNKILDNPIEAISVNLHGSEIVLNSAAKFNKRIFIASTSEIYGKNLKQPLSESDDRVIGAPQKFRWTYSDAKALEEAHAHYLYMSRNLDVTTIRFFNTVGPRQTGKYGMVIPRMVNAALSNSPLFVYGDGKQSRVFCHVTDAVSGVLKLVDRIDVSGEVFNIGGKNEINIEDLAKKIITQTNSKSEIVFRPYSEVYGIGFEETQRRVPDISKILKYTGWEPELKLGQIIEDIVNHKITET
jgi:UDP-glucose 4-epimerase